MRPCVKFCVTVAGSPIAVRATRIEPLLNWPARISGTPAALAASRKVVNSAEVGAVPAPFSTTSSTSSRSPTWFWMSAQLHCVTA